MATRIAAVYTGRELGRGRPSDSKEVVTELGRARPWGMRGGVRIDRRSALGFAIGAAIGGASWWRSARRAPLERVAIWLADRGAGQVVGLNSELLHRVVIPVVHPIAVQPALDGGVWVVSNLRGQGSGSAFEWLLFDAEGDLRFRGEWAGFRCLISDGCGGCWALVGGGSSLERRGPDGVVVFRLDAGEFHSSERAVAPLTSEPVESRSRRDAFGARGLAANAADQLIAWRSNGELQLVEGSRVTRRECFREEVLDLCAEANGWWMLTEGQLLELGPDLSVRRAWRAPERAARLFYSSTGSGVWTLDQLGKRAELVGDRTRGWRVRKWRLAGACVLRELKHEALLATTPGALIVLDRSGDPRAGQGGFDHLVALALATDVDLES